MDRLDYLNERIREKSEAEAFDILLKEMQQVEIMEVLNWILLPQESEVLEQNRVLKIKGHEINAGIFYGLDTDLINKNIDLLTEKIYKDKINSIVENI